MSHLDGAMPAQSEGCIGRCDRGHPEAQCDLDDLVQLGFGQVWRDLEDQRSLLPADALSRMALRMASRRRVRALVGAQSWRVGRRDIHRHI